MAEAVTQLKIPVQSPSEKIGDVLAKRRSQELILAFCGPAGSRIDLAVDSMSEELKKTYEYEVVKIKVSELIKKNIHHIEPSFDFASLKDPAQRYLKLQDAGNALRDSQGCDILAQLSVVKISLHRQSKQEQSGESADRYSHRVAYLIDSLKHPEEVNFLRAIYRNMFFLIGVYCPIDIRRSNLKALDMKGSDAEMIMERDVKQAEKHGQQLLETLQYADFFINNDKATIESKKTKRFLDLCLGQKIVSPTVDEFGMYLAQSAALRSGCLSRQIGAAILTDTGEVISTGYNDVPRKGGGLYFDASDEEDHRCAFMPENECHSDKFKKKIVNQIESILTSSLNDKTKAEELTKEIAKSTRIKDLIEFSRAVHAEMEAIMAAARMGVSTKDANLYTTTFPCHNCARHIIAAGIKKVLFIQPYEKSLALTLHGNDIQLDPSASKQATPAEVIMSHFEGVAPRQYLNFFTAFQRKENGKGIIVKPEKSMPLLPEYLDPWCEVEDKVVLLLKKRFSFET